MPILPVILINGRYEFPTLALVDSGAVSGVISTVIADTLHVDWAKVPVRFGFSVGGNFRFHPVILQVVIYDHKFSLKLNVAEGIAPIRCILGQEDLFKRAKIIFEGYKKQFKIVFREFN